MLGVCGSQKFLNLGLQSIQVILESRSGLLAAGEVLEGLDKMSPWGARRGGSRRYLCQIGITGGATWDISVLLRSHRGGLRERVVRPFAFGAAAAGRRG